MSRADERGDSGLVTLELALVMPLLLLLFAGATAFGHRIFVRHEVTRLATLAARDCVVRRFVGTPEVCEARAQGLIAEEHAAAWFSTCGAGEGGGAGGLRAEVSILEGPETATATATATLRLLEVKVTCDYQGVVAPGLLRTEPEGPEVVSRSAIIASARMPFAVRIEEPPRRAAASGGSSNQHTSDDSDPPPSRQNIKRRGGGGFGFPGGWGAPSPGSDFWLAPTGPGGVPLPHG